MRAPFMFLEFVTAYPALVSVTAVAIGWFATRRGQIRGDRAKHSHAYLGILDKDDHLKSLKTITPLLNKGEVYIESNFPEKQRSEISGALWDCLQVMERASISIKMGYISEEYFCDSYKTLSDRLFRVSYHYISNIRTEKNAPSIWKNYENLFLRIQFPERPLIVLAVEYLYVCPRFSVTERLISAHIDTADKEFGHFLIELFRRSSLPAEKPYLHNIDKLRRGLTQRVYILRAIEIICFVSACYYLI